MWYWCTIPCRMLSKTWSDELRKLNFILFSLAEPLLWLHNMPKPNFDLHSFCFAVNKKQCSLSIDTWWWIELESCPDTHHFVLWSHIIAYPLALAPFWSTFIFIELVDLLFLFPLPLNTSWCCFCFKFNFFYNIANIRSLIRSRLSDWNTEIKFDPKFKQFDHAAICCAHTANWVVYIGFSMITRRCDEHHWHLSSILANSDILDGSHSSRQTCPLSMKCGHFCANGTTCEWPNEKADHRKQACDSISVCSREWL